MANTVRFTITSENPIHCESCERRIATALRRLPGVEQVTASSKTQEVTVVFDPAQVSEAQLRTKLEQVGFAPATNGGRA